MFVALSTILFAGVSPARDGNMFKIGKLQNDKWVAHNYGSIYTLEHTKGPDRFLIGTSGDAATIFLTLSTSIKSPYFVLYILHTPRTDAKPGRYQSPAISESELKSFFTKFADFFSTDGRHDIWVHSPEEEATVVWDRHDLIYAYGSLNKFRAILKQNGFTEGVPQIPFPHQHNYHPSFDSQQSEVLKTFEWRYSQLRPEDEQ